MKKKRKRLNIHDWKKIALRTAIAADIESRKSTAGSSEIINKKRSVKHSKHRWINH